MTHYGLAALLMALLAPGPGAREEVQAPRAPVVAVTHHTGTFNGQNVKYSATVGETFIPGPDGATAAVMVNTAYLREDVPDRTRRPVMFVFNGGPGASSSPLHMSAFGPRRRTEGGARIIENPFSPIDVVDLVFIDPIGTGFSRPLPGADGQPFWSVSGDAASVKTFIETWLKTNGRESSPRFLCGESYGTVRAGQIISTAQAAKDLFFDGVLLFSLPGRPSNEELSHALTFPSFAVTAAYHGQVETYRGLNLDINAKWQFDVEGALEDTAKRIGQAMRNQSNLRLFWAAGYYDITTPLAAGRYTLEHAGIPRDRLTIAAFATGHSVFDGDDNLARFTDAVRTFVTRRK